MTAKNEYPRASNAAIVGGVTSYIGGLLLMMSFASPYWVKSLDETFSNFKNMGLWEYCFDQFRYPNYQFDKLFNGCHYVFSEEYYVIREWLLPGWLMVVQSFVTLGLMLSYFSQILIAFQVIRWPVDFVLKYEYMISGVAFICNAATAVFVFLGVAIFGGEAWRRDWLMYPNFNYLSWSYGLAVVAFFLHAFAAFSIYLDARRLYEIKKESKNLVLQMHPSSSNGYDLQ